MDAAVKIPVFMSAVDFMAWDPGDGRPWQLVDGVPKAMLPTNRTQGALQGEFARLIGNHLADQSSPCSILIAPGIVPRVLAGCNVRVPDLAVTCSSYDCEETLLEAPILVVEVISPNNQAETWSNLWTYTTIPSVREIVMLRSTSVGADLLCREADGHWPSMPETITGGDLVLSSIGARFPLASIYRTTRLARPGG